MALKVEKILTPRTELGEGPHWDSLTRCLYFVDIFGKSIHKYNPESKQHSFITIGKHVSTIIPVYNKSDEFVVTLEREIVRIKWKDQNLEILESIGEVDLGDLKGNRINDGKCDKSGRFWFGTMGAEPINGEVERNKGTLFSYTPKTNIRKHFNQVDISNGIAWSLDGRYMYYIDSYTRCIDRFDFDLLNGDISNRRSVFSFDTVGLDGFPDGMTSDTDGNLWIAIFNGYKVIQIDPRRENALLQTIDIPAKQVTSVAFGGETMSDLYVTTAKFQRGDDILEGLEHGALYRITGLNVKGNEQFNIVL